jgi:hypothetical protein
MTRTLRPIVSACLLVACPFWASASPTVEGTPWARHAIDNTSQGADGARLADANGDGRMDVCVPWEEGGEIRVYLHPGAAQARQPWPKVCVGRVGSPEDAVFADVDGDGNLDVVSSSEGKTQTVWVHWAPAPERYLDPQAWRTEAFPATVGRSRWMFCLPMQVDDQRGVDLVVASKDPNGQVGWLEAPENPRDLSAWRYHLIRSAGWVMSLLPDGKNLLLSDRKGPRRGCWRLTHPGAGKALFQPWPETALGGVDEEVMFMHANATIQHVAVREGPILRIQPDRPDTSIPMPQHTGTGKSAAADDVDGDGAEELVVSCENAQGLHGVFYLKERGGGDWVATAISGLEGTKFDLLQLIDLDGDGDLDVLTCEERENLGVIWYENPTKSP